VGVLQGLSFQVRQNKGATSCGEVRRITKMIVRPVCRRRSKSGAIAARQKR
jgi:hypothetical protein